MASHLRTMPPPHLGISASLKADLIAGVTSGCAIAYASLAGLPVQTGLYDALAGLVTYALRGTSPLLSVSITPTLAILKDLNATPANFLQRRFSLKEVPSMYLYGHVRWAIEAFERSAPVAAAA